MDDTQQSRVSDAAATRKRRSSILKSQRPARTPFSELEFNVATPTDTAKSRRVSFSRRTGVAEFITNEATTTWKNFYEEHNKSLESSSNDSEANASRQPVGHLGKRIFDQQFEEVEAVDFIGSLNPLATNGSMNNNFTQQLAALECTANGTVTAPQNNFEISAFTDQQSKIFGNDFDVPCVGEGSGVIDVNFSVIQQIGTEKDDLDEIQQDLARVNGIGCKGPFSERENNEYIEIDLNMTHVARTDDDISITDTINSPLQNVSKSTLNKKSSSSFDWATDKENIAINPYDVPRESANFALNEEPNQVLVFDGKRLTLQPDKPEKPDKNYRQTLLPNSSAETPQRKTIVLNMDDDLPNFVDDMLNSKSEHCSANDLKSSTICNAHDISLTLPVNIIDIVPQNQKSTHDCSGNISMTQALPTNIITDTTENINKRRTILFEESTGNISVTQSLPVKILSKNTERRRTVVYEDDTGNISITQSVPAKIITNEYPETIDKSKTIVYDDDLGNISVTQAIPSNIILENKDKTKTIVFDGDAGNVSITQAIPANIVMLEKQSQEKRRTIIYDDDSGNISVTQAVSSNVILSNKESVPERRRTVIYENDTGNISITQAVPSNILENMNLDDDATKVREINNFTETGNNLKEFNNKRRTIVYEDDTGDISITHVLPAQLIPGYVDDNGEVPTSIEEPKILNSTRPAESHTSNTIDNGKNDVSMTDIVSVDIIDEVKNKIKSISDVSMINNNILSADTMGEAEIKRKSTNDMSMIKNISADTIEEAKIKRNSINDVSMIKMISADTMDEAKIKRKSANDVSMIKMISADTIEEAKIKRKSTNGISMINILSSDAINEDNNKIKPTSDVSMINIISADAIDQVMNKRKTIHYDDADGDVSMTLAIATNAFLLDKLDSAVDHSVRLQEEIMETNENVIDYELEQEAEPVIMVDDLQEQRKRFTLHEEDGGSEMSITEAIPKVQTIIQASEKRKTIIFDSDNCNLSMTKPIPADLVAFQNEVINKFEAKQDQVQLELEMANPCADVIVYQASTPTDAPKSIRTDEGDQESDGLINSNVNSEAKISQATNDTEGSLTAADCSADVSLLHPRVEEKSDQLNLKASFVAKNTEKSIVNAADIPNETADVEQIIEKPKDSVLNTLLDMSSTNMENSIEDKSVIVETEPVHATDSTKDAMMGTVPSQITGKDDTDNTSRESMFYIRDTDEGAQTDKDWDQAHSDQSHEALQQQLPLQLEYKDEKPKMDNLQKKIAELKTAVNEKHTTFNRFYEKISYPDSEVAERDENVKLRQQSVNFKKANDTKELLDMISDFTEDKEDDDDERESIVVKVRRRPALEDKSNAKINMTESRRPSIVPKRQSIALSREDLLNNISMAQAALQKSRLALDDSESIDEDTKETSTVRMTSRKSGNDVVKTLHFDEESISESSFRSDAKGSPLKKTAFGETSYMTESKSKVIPTYLKDVSDGIKELMLDLVKPAADNLPFEGGGIDKDVKRVPSTQSTQIQANLITSSQVDIESEVYSNPGSVYEMDKISSFTGGALHKSRSRSFRSPVKFSTSSEKSSEFEVPGPAHRYLYTKTHQEPPPPPRVLVFDHLNPLNNILLGPIDYTEAHRYNPKKSEETLCGSERSRSAVIHFDENTKDNDYEVDTMTQYRVLCDYKPEGTRSMVSTDCRPISTDQSIDTKIMELKDNEANTLIAMKGNKELLEASSSLTLVDESTEQPSDGELECTTTTSQDAWEPEPPIQQKEKPTKLPRKSNDITAEKDKTSKESVSQDKELIQHAKKCKSKKRVYSPNKDKPTLSVELTPKPVSKLQKISTSPHVCKAIELSASEEAMQMAPEKDVTDSDVGVESVKYERKKSPRKSKEKNPGTSVTVQQLITEFGLNSGLAHNLDKQILDAINPKSGSSTAPASQSDMIECLNLDLVSSFTSSKNFNVMKDVNSVSTTESHHSDHSTALSKGSKIDWHPDLVSAISSQLVDTDSGVNVVAKIDMLPFMGSHECEWESSSGDTWSFRLLHGRLRLTARLAHRHDNATRTRVRGDTPVLDIDVETVQLDKKNPVATLCVRFACETMRYMVSRTCRGTCFATDIPPLLRRCAAVARVALRWGRAMHDAKLHLAYTLDNDGYLSLKVANIPLRSVWEVSMRVELVVEDARQAPWPRAGNVRVQRVVSDVLVPDAAVRRALAHTPRDWGHAPRTVWRMFRYLKNKTRDDDILLGA